MRVEIESKVILVTSDSSVGELTKGELICLTERMLNEQGAVTLPNDRQVLVRFHFRGEGG